MSQNRMIVGIPVRIRGALETPICLIYSLSSHWKTCRKWSHTIHKTSNQITWDSTSLNHVATVICSNWKGQHSRRGLKCRLGHRLHSNSRRDPKSRQTSHHDMVIRQGTSLKSNQLEHQKKTIANQSRWSRKSSKSKKLGRTALSSCRLKHRWLSVL